MNLGNAIRSVRKELDISQRKLAESCGISQTSLSQIETGSKRPSQRTLKKICEVLNVPESILYILGFLSTDMSANTNAEYQKHLPSMQILAWKIVQENHKAIAV